MHLRWHLPGTATDPLRLSRDMPALLERFRKCLKERAPDGLVLSGDVLDVPASVIAGNSPDERSREDWLAKAIADFKLVREWLESVGVPYVVVPGNNDEESAFAEVFGGPPAPADIAGLRFFCFWDELSNENQPLRTGERKALFDAAMTSPEHDCPQVHVHHYMIHPPTFAKNKHYQYRTADELKLAAESSGRVRAVLSGHYHPGTLVEGPVLHSGAPAFCEAPFPYRVYDFDSGGAATVTDCEVGA